MIQVHESYDHEFSTFFNHDAVDKMVLRKNKNEIYYVRENGQTGIKVNKWVFIDNQRYELLFPEILHYPVSSFDDSSYKETVIYRGNVYTIAGLRSVTQGEISDLYHCLNGLWGDIEIDGNMPDIIRSPHIIEGKINSHYFQFAREQYNNSWIPLINGHSVTIYRKITVADLKTSYKEIEKKVTVIEKNKELAAHLLKWYAIHMSEYLCISPERYKKGSFNLNDQMIKRLHSKINSKTK